MNEITSINYPGGSSRIVAGSRNELLSGDTQLSVFDSNTAALFANRDPERSVVLPSGETAKTWLSVERIIKRALTLSLGRDGIMCAIGGGVVTDVTALAASIYMRGCRLIQVPTTLLAMVDAAIGGKTGIDFGGVKNLIGTFYPAEEVRICPAILETLPKEEYLSGMAEVIKHALLSPTDAAVDLMDLLRSEQEAIRSRDMKILELLIPAAIDVKVRIVTKDLHDKGSRAFLNLGHTFAHALESATSFCKWSHGEAVAWGITRALELGVRLGITDRNWANESTKLIHDYGFHRVTVQVAPDAIKAAMSYDKKKKDSQLRFILMKKAGEPVIEEVPEADLNAVLGIE